MSSEYHSYTFVFVIHFSRQIRVDQRFIVGVRNNHKNVRLEARIRRTVVRGITVRLRGSRILPFRGIGIEHTKNCCAKDDCSDETD